MCEEECVCTRAHLVFCVHVYKSRVSRCNYPHLAFRTILILYYINPPPMGHEQKKNSELSLKLVHVSIFPHILYVSLSLSPHLFKPTLGGGWSQGAILGSTPHPSTLGMPERSTLPLEEV